MKFKKFALVFGSILVLGALMSLSLAEAGITYPKPFVNNGVSDVAIVYGANSAVSDLNGANKISNNLKSVYDGYNPNIAFGLGVSEDKVALGQKIAGQGSLRSVFTDNQIPSLIDSKIYWDDGLSTKTTYNVHEEVLLGDMSLKTTLDERDLNETALTNNKALGYKYVFEDKLNTSRIGMDDVNPLKVSILGKEYEVKKFGSDYMTVSTSEEKVLSNGDSVSFDNATLTVDSIFTNAVQVNDKLISLGHTELVDGLKVKVESIAYSSSDKYPSKVVLRFGKELYTTYTNGDAYVNQDKYNPIWVWSISSPGEAGGYIGVQYNEREMNSDDNLVYAGESYSLPEDYAKVEFLGLTDAQYENFTLSFDDSRDLFYAENDGEVMYNDAEVLELVGPKEDSFLVNGVQTNTLYLRYNSSIEFFNQTSDESESIPGVDVFYKDVDRDYSTNAKPRYALTINNSDTRAIAKLVNKDTSLNISIDNRTLTVGELSIELNPKGNFTSLGNESEEAEASELQITEGSEVSNVGNEEKNILSHKGLVVYESKDNSKNDEVLFSVPSEQVYGKVGVFGRDISGDTHSESTFGSVIVKDTEVNSVTHKNLIVVGGSCVNSVAAGLLGSSVPLCGDDWTAVTGIGAGQFLVKQYTSPYDNSKVALLVAGYNAEDTTSAVSELLS